MSSAGTCGSRSPSEDPHQNTDWRQQNFLYVQDLSSNGVFSWAAKHAIRANNRSFFDLSRLWNELGWACRTSRIFTIRFHARRPTIAQTHSLLTSRMPENVASPLAAALQSRCRQNRPKKAGSFLQKNRCATKREHAPSPRILGITKACLFSLRNASAKLRILAPLPTTTPESARLCALSLASIVSLPLPISGRV